MCRFECTTLLLIDVASAGTTLLWMYVSFECTALLCLDVPLEYTTLLFMYVPLECTTLLLIDVPFGCTTLLRIDVCTVCVHHLTLHVCTVCVHHLTVKQCTLWVHYLTSNRCLFGVRPPGVHCCCLDGLYFELFVRCLLFVVGCSPFFCCLLFVVGGLMFALCCLLFVLMCRLGALSFGGSICQTIPENFWISCIMCLHRWKLSNATFLKDGLNWLIGCLVCLLLFVVVDCLQCQYRW